MPVESMPTESCFPLVCPVCMSKTDSLQEYHKNQGKDVVEVAIPIL